MINKTILVGHVGKDPECRTMKTGDKVVSFSLATTESWKDKQGNRQTITEWHNISVFNQGLIKLLDYVSKGSLLYVEGQLKTSKWCDKNGTDHYTTEVVLGNYKGVIKLLDKPKAAKDDKFTENFGNQPAKQDDMDDEIPF